MSKFTLDDFRRVNSQLQFLASNKPQDFAPLVQQEYNKTFMGSQRPTAAWIKSTVYKLSPELQQLKSKTDLLFRKASELQLAPGDERLPHVVKLTTLANLAKQQELNLWKDLRKQALTVLSC